MASKLDKSLEEIAGSRRNGPRAGARRGGRKPAPAVAGGITKKTAPKAAAKPTKGATAPTPALPARGESKIIVSNLPDDVNEQQIKEYFSSTVGSVKKVLMTYTKTGRSAGVATIIFAQPTSAAEAAKTYDGVKVDGRPMKIEVVMGARYVPEPPAPKGLKDRIATPKSAAAKPKAAVTGKTSTANAPAAGATRGKGRAGRGGRKAARPRKTAEELDADMADYFDPNAAAPAAAAATTGAAPAAVATNGGETAMVEDEIM